MTGVPADNRQKAQFPQLRITGKLFLISPRVIISETALQKNVRRSYNTLVYYKYTCKKQHDLGQLPFFSPVVSYVGSPLRGQKLIRCFSL